MSDGVARVDSVEATPSNEAESLTLAEREARWGFSLDELRAATKVVRILIQNPSLYISDPYLAESRLYTMITRDQASKRKFREVHKVIMNEEKSRRRRFARMQDAEALHRTVMKREREDALQAALLPPDAALLLCDGIETGETVTTTDERTEAETCHLRHPHQSTPGDGDGDGGNANKIERSDAQSASMERQERQRRLQLLALVGAFENIVRLEAECAKSLAEVDYLLVAHLTSQFYRFMPHPYGSQMPPVLRCDPIPGDLSPAWRHLYTAGAKLCIAHHCVDLVKCPPNTSLLPAEDVLVPPTASLRSVHVLRQCGDLSTAPSDVVTVCANTHKVDDALRIIETYLTTGIDAGGYFSDQWSADLSLNLYLARRLYARKEIRDCGESPVELQTRPPRSEDEELDICCPFDSAQRYVSEEFPPLDEQLQINRWISCNICRVRYNKLHPYYYSLCNLCAEYNFSNRLLTRDLRGKVVLLTGCRIKIGFAVALSLLRCGARLLGTTRFAHEALMRFQQEADYETWKDRLHLFSLDLRDMWVVTQFCGFVTQRFPKLFAIINNAAQTIARTPEYTARVRQVETHPTPDVHTALYNDNTTREWHQFFLSHSTVMVGEPLHIEYHPHDQPFLPESIDSGSVENTNEENKDVTNGTEVALTRTVNHAGRESKSIVFDRYDTRAEESDVRESNSWVLRLAEVQGSEAAEVMVINALSPFILNSKLKPCLANRVGDAVGNEARFIINVSAMEGQFYRHKQVTHPHTNMAKAALNMMTRTSAEDYAQDSIYMNSVDTGWITDELPKTRKERLDAPRLCPLDEVDAAARCLFLIYTNSKEYGKFFKDYKEIPW